MDVEYAWRLSKAQAYLRSRRMFPPFARARRKDWAARERLRIFMQYTTPGSKEKAK